MVKQNKTKTFTTEAWYKITDTIANAFHLEAMELARYRENKTAKLIAAIPFIAGCRQPLRTAVAHVAVYQLARREAKDIFLHDIDDDASIMDRLFEGSSFNGGDERIIKHGMNLLALQMIRGYAKDWSDDIMHMKYNPLVHRSWNFEAEEESLIKEIRAIDCPEMDAVMSLNDVDGYWDAG
ncbi:MAG: hypothetical protein PQJ61_09030 [Spirochaetales bacterium]|uniref:Uncharacterized protein n=1 Tax=Candidatus Thalassospirochaeta sargassi TaxID=3119039 RepID=A0AAJ1MJ07_9SPIO|nr:hypothetical protein [Spirochaetales bacterium]